jgi:DNA-binding transcriptional LysR family regulator
MALPELRHLRYLVAVADARSFTRAARALNIAQPALSQQIRQLEHLTGVILLHRRPQVTPTEAGEALLTSARRVLAEVAGGIEDARRVRRGETGQLTIGFASSVVFTPLRHAFRRFRELHPDVRLVLRELHSGAQLAALRDGAIDLALTRDAPVEASLRAETLLSDSLTVLLARRHSLSGRRRLGIDELAVEPLILFPRALAITLYEQIERLYVRAGHPLHVSCEAHEWHTISGLVESGMGVSIAPASIASLRWPGVCYRPLHPRAELTALTACYDPARLRTPVTAFLALVREASSAGRGARPPHGQRRP